MIARSAQHLRVGEVHERGIGLARSIGWDVAGRFLCSRLGRLLAIDGCPTIYIGSAGTHAGSKNTLHARYLEFATRHTAQYPVSIWGQPLLHV